MVHGHTFDPMGTSWGRRTVCMVVTGGTNEHPEYCGRVYDEHALRPGLSRDELDQEPNEPDDYGFFHHKYGCAVLTEVCGTCNCGMVENNISRLIWLAESQAGKAREMASWGQSINAETMPSTEFRTAYAGIEKPTDVTVNGRVIGRWTPNTDLTQA
jgi:hypothetical protein